MTDDRSLERAARSWIEAGPTRAPDQVVEHALHLIATTPQERDLRVLRRIQMPTIARVAAAAAIGVLVVGGALLMFGRPSQSDGNPPPTPSPSGASASPAFVGVGPLAAGPYFVTVGGVTFNFELPAGWSGAPVPGFAVLKQEDPADLDSVILSFWQPNNVYGDPCNGGSLLNPSVGPTVGDLVTALAAQPFTETTVPAPVSVDGFSGQRIEYSVNPDAADCSGMLWLWRDTDGSDRTEDHDQLNELTILDVAGSRVVIDLSYLPDTTQQDRAELDRIFQTIQIEP
jgi:hypothetical protein